MVYAVVAGALLAIIAGVVEVGPNVCEVDFLVPQGGGWELLRETEPCDKVNRVLEFLAE